MKNFYEYLETHADLGKDHIQLKEDYLNETIYLYKDEAYEDKEILDEAIAYELGKYRKVVTDELIADEWDNVEQVKRKEVLWKKVKWNQ